MNPLLECFASFVVWAEAGAVASARTPEQVFGHRHWQIMSRAQRLLPPGKSRLLCGVLGLMLFRAADWRTARETLMEVAPAAWRDAILPTAIQPARLLKAITMSSEAIALLSDMGFGQDSALAALFATFLAHPKSLRMEIVGLLDEGWEAGLGEWWTQASPAVRAATRGFRPGHGDTVHEIPVAMLASGRLTVATPAGELILVPAPQPISAPTSAAEPVVPAVVGHAGADSEARAKGRAARQKTGSVEETAQAYPAAATRGRVPSGSRALGAGPGIPAERLPDERQVEVFRALSDSTRISIISELTKAPSFPGTLAIKLGVSPPTMSHHVSVLRQAGLIRVTKRQGFSQLTLKHEVLRGAAEALLQLAEPPAEAGAAPGDEG